ncbi:MAG: CHAD domain-containing protein [Halomonas sp.]
MQTLESIDAELADVDLMARARVSEALYTFEGQALLAWLRSLSAEVERVLLIGRNPALLQLAKANLAIRLHGLLHHQRRRVRALEPGVVAGIDPEFLHQYRVNLRRSRAPRPARCRPGGPCPR